MAIAIYFITSSHTFNFLARNSSFSLLSPCITISNTSLDILLFVLLVNSVLHLFQPIYLPPSMDLQFFKPTTSPQEESFHHDLRRLQDKKDDSHIELRNERLTDYHLDGKRLRVEELPILIPPNFTSEHYTNLPTPGPGKILIQNPLKFGDGPPQITRDPLVLHQKAQDALQLYNHDIQQIVLSLLPCDDNFCEDYETAYTHLLVSIWKDKRPNLFKQFVTCVELGETLGDCQKLHDEGVDFAKPLLDDLLSIQRQATPDPLLDYQGYEYSSPFWFELAGNIWRRIDHGSRRISVYNCRRIRSEAEQCLVENHVDDSGPDICYRLYQHSLICEPGSNCPYLRYPLLNCFRQVENPDYDRFRSCVKSIPNYSSCRFAPASQWSLHNNGKHFPDMSEYMLEEGQPQESFPLAKFTQEQEAKVSKELKKQESVNQFYPSEDDKPTQLKYDWLGV